MNSSKSKNDELSVDVWPEWKWFEAVANLINEILPKIQDRNYDEVGSIYPLIDSVIESTDTLRTLVKNYKLRDSYVIARVIFETSVNACFILTSPDALSVRASTHAKQKALRNLTRTIEIAGDQIFKFESINSEELLNHDLHQTWLTQFTTKSGREITSWTPENVQQRIEVVYREFGGAEVRGLAFGLLLYRHASEIAHGTLFGTLFSWGAMEPGTQLNSQEDISKFRHKELRHLMKLISYSLESAIRVICRVINEPDISNAACKARKQYFENRSENA